MSASKTQESAKKAPNHYETLGVSHTAKQSEIKKAYTGIALKNHPDKLPKELSAAEKEARTERFRSAHEAYKVIGDEAKRKEYDSSLSEASPSSSAQAPQSTALMPRDQAPKSTISTSPTSTLAAEDTSTLAAKEEMRAPKEKSDARVLNVRFMAALVTILVKLLSTMIANIATNMTLLKGMSKGADTSSPGGGIKAIDNLPLGKQEPGKQEPGKLEQSEMTMVPKSRF